MEDEINDLKFKVHHLEDYLEDQQDKCERKIEAIGQKYVQSFRLISLYDTFHL